MNPSELVNSAPYRKRTKAGIFFFSLVFLYNIIFSPDGLRKLSISYGNGKCRWQPPNYFIPEDIDWIKTLVVGFPSGDKRLVFMQLEALTGWSSRDEWAYEVGEMTNHPFLKSNYPHYDGMWGWQDAADQVVLVVRNLRNTLVEFHAIMWDLGFATTYAAALLNEDNLFSAIPPKESFLMWRDEKVITNIHYFGWFLDYWMEGGILRDSEDHSLLTAEDWFITHSPDMFYSKESTYSEVVGDNPSSTPAYDQRCVNFVSGGCEPVAVISGENLEKNSQETHKLGKILEGKRGISDYLIEEDAWDCLWEELIVNKKGAKTFLDRGMDTKNYNFSEEMIDLMLEEVNRLIDKYRSSPWNSKQTANDLVSILAEHKVALEEELIEVQVGARVLTEDDFLGPNTRRELNRKKLQDAGADATTDIRELTSGDYQDFFKKLDEKMHAARMLHKKEEVVREERRLKMEPLK